ncbi:MAG: phenylalanine--tRNA ligase subunit alpha, partial [Oscillospiraceae bacterium]
MKELLQKLKEGSLSDILGAESLEVLDSLKVKYLGKKGELTAILKQMGKLDETQRPIIGQLANEVREDITQGLENKRIALAEKQLERRLRSETIDVTIPGKPVSVGKKHPLNTVLDEAADIFLGMGFTIAEGPEIEYSVYNFDKLNTAEGHPARDRQDTFYFDDEDSLLLRTQTSPVQARVMETQPLPIRIISPGRVYRKDEVDATHSPMFHQFEGLV